MSWVLGVRWSAFARATPAAGRMFTRSHGMYTDKPQYKPAMCASGSAWGWASLCTRRVRLPAPAGAISSVSSLIDDTCGSSSEVNDLPIVTGDEILLRPRLVCADCVLLRVLACRRISLSGVVPTAARLLLVLRSGGVRERSITLSV